MEINGILNVKEDIQNNINELHKDLLNDRITHESKIRPIIPVVEIAGCNFASKGDLSIVGGLPKAGKTSTSMFMLATALMKDVSNKDTLDIRTKFSEGKPVIYIDTEQPQAYTDKLRRNVCKLIGKPENDPSFENTLFFINLRKYSSEEKQNKVFEWMQFKPDTHLWIIDGVADLIKDPNDTREAFGIIERLMISSDAMDTTIICYIHENPGSTGKLRGNLGSEAERKCGGALSVKKIKDKGIHCIEAKLIRGAADFEPIFFRYNKEQGRMVSISGEEKEELKKGTDKVKIKENLRLAMAKRCLLTGGLKSKDLVKSIIDFAEPIEGKSIKARTAELRINEMKEMGIISLDDSGFYRLADIYIPQP